ncbi:MAG: DUF1015 domain-containing protein [Deltaproteobacteria bacterium]|nr:DUF1015 domain-containing protein [Deltaproteobacteria bacterium]
MSIIAPLRGSLYNQSLIPNLADVVTPPYDVIPAAKQVIYHDRHPHNVIRLILGQALPEDNESNNRYTRSAGWFKEWQASQVLVRDEKPAIYLYELVYNVPNGARLTRRGFISLLKLEEFGKGSVYPHERTFSKTKSERFRFSSICHANFSPGFVVYSDPAMEIQNHLDQGKGHRPVCSFVDEDKLEHRLWAVTDPEVLTWVCRQMRPKDVFIADGHHRYETSIAYRDMMRQRYPEAGDRAPFNYRLMYFCNMSQEGVTILPAHRMIHRVPDFDREGFLRQAQDFFEIEALTYQTGDRAATLDKFKQVLSEKGQSSNTIGFYANQDNTFYLLTLRHGALDRAPWVKDVPKVLRAMDTVVLTDLIFTGLLGFTAKDQDDEHKILYSSITEEALEKVYQGEHDLAFILNPTKIEQVEAVARAHLVMPRKSTYFYPKVYSGLVFNPINPEEEILELA